MRKHSGSTRRRKRLISWWHEAPGLAGASARARLRARARGRQPFHLEQPTDRPQRVHSATQRNQEAPRPLHLPQSLRARASRELDSIQARRSGGLRTTRPADTRQGTRTAGPKSPLLHPVELPQRAGGVRALQFHLAVEDAAGGRSNQFVLFVLHCTKKLPGSASASRPPWGSPKHPMPPTENSEETGFTN